MSEMQLLHQLLKGVYTLKHSLNCAGAASPPLPLPPALRTCPCVWLPQPCARPFIGTLAMGGAEGAAVLHQVHFSLVVCDPFTAERL